MLENARYLHEGLRALGFHVLGPTHLKDGREIITPVVPVVVGDDWKAVFLWKSLYEAGVFVNVAIHPAVPPAGALLRCSVMATHDTATLDQRPPGVRGDQARIRGRTRPAWASWRSGSRKSRSKHAKPIWALALREWLT